MDMMAIRRRVLMGFKKARLPKEYREVEYIESTQEQYIDTGYSPNINTELICDFGSFSFVTSDGGGNYRGPYGCSDTSNNARAGISKAQGASRVYTSFGNKVDITYITTGTSSWANRTLHSLSKNGVYENGINVLLPYSNLSFGETNKHIFVFARSSNDGMAERFVEMKLYKFSIKENDVLIKEFIPCYRKSDEEIGLYDTVSKTFYTNAGTGTFLKGADV